MGRRLGLVGLFVLAVLGLGASPAQAHATLEETAPTRGQIVDPAPTVVTLTFSEHVTPVKDRIRVVAPDGSDVVDGEPGTSGGGRQIRIPLKKNIADGTYLVSYRIVSADGHPVAGGYTFSSRVPSAAGAKLGDLPTTGDSASIDPVVRGVQSVARYATYAGIALLLGPMVILLQLWPRRLTTKSPQRLAWTGWGLLFGGTLGVLVLQQPYTDGGPLTDLSSSGLGATLDGTVGRALAARLVLLLVAIPAMRWVLRPPTGDKSMAGVYDRVSAAILGVAVLLTFPLAGHAGQSPAPWLSGPAIALHVAAMAIWLGGLVVLARYLLPRASYQELAVVLPVWSRWAFWAVAALVFSGAVETFLEIGGFGGIGSLFTTTYGQLVLTKVIWLVAILVLAANARAWVHNRFGAPVAYALAAESPGRKPAAQKPTAQKGAAQKRAPQKPAAQKMAAQKAAVQNSAAKKGVPRKKGAKDREPEVETSDFSASGKNAPGVKSLRMRVTIEVVLGAVVLALATALVQVAPARNAADAIAADLPYSKQVDLGPNVLQIDLDPTRIGKAEVHLTLFDQSGQPVKVEEWRGSAELASANVSTDLFVVPLTSNHGTGYVELPLAGDWEFTFTARTTDIDQYSVKQTITIR